MLVIVFFVGVWIVFLYAFSRLSESHSWILPVFAMGLGAPRWAQILWSISNMGQYLPWTAGPVASGLAGRSLWLWLGVLDAVQGVGKCQRFHSCISAVSTLYTQPFGEVGSRRLTYPNRIWNDTPSNVDSISHTLHAHCVADTRLFDNHHC